MIYFFFNDTATTEIYTLSYTTLFRSFELPLNEPANNSLRVQNYNYGSSFTQIHLMNGEYLHNAGYHGENMVIALRSEEHTSELQSHSDLVCRLLLEKKKKEKNSQNYT